MEIISDPRSPFALSIASIARRLAQGLPAALAFAGLAAFAVWGVRTEWRFGWPSSAERVPSAKSGVGSAEVRESGGVVVLDLGTAANAEKAGLEAAPVWTEPMSETIVANGETSFDPAKVARISALASGTVWRVGKTAGDWVKRGELLAILDAAAVGKAKADFQEALVRSRLARQALKRAQGAGAALADRKRQEAEAASRQAETALLCAQQDLINLGLPARIEESRDLSIDVLAERMRTLGFSEWFESGAASPGWDAGWGAVAGEGATSCLLPLRSSLEGMAINADLVAGEVAPVGKTLFTVADPRRLWLTLHVRAKDAGRASKGQRVIFRPDGMADDFAGLVIGIGAAADEATRTVPVRVELDNAGGRLKASALGQGRILVREAPEAVTVPNEAVRSFRGGSIVFVRDPRYFEDGGPKTFSVRKVRIGAQGPARSEVLEGLRAGETVAVQGSDFLLRELSRFAVNSNSADSGANP